VNAHGGTSEGEAVCNRLAASFTGRHEEDALHVLSVQGPHTTEGVLDRVHVGSSPGARRSDSGLQVEAGRPVTARTVSCSHGLEPRDGACRRHGTSEVGVLPGKARPALVRRGGSDIETSRALRRSRDEKSSMHRNESTEAGASE
jgi:hypothetical protein